MKAAALLTSLLLVSSQAQEVILQQPNTPAEANRAEQRQEAAEAKQADPQAPAPPLKPVILYRGFLVEFTRAEDKKRFLSLRQARDPRHDYRNVHIDERTGRPKGFVLFSLSF